MKIEQFILKLPNLEKVVIWAQTVGPEHGVILNVENPDQGCIFMLTPEEARQIAAALNRFADKVQ